MILKAYAKINLSLNVVGLREDGYHELDMLMVPLADLYDVLEINKADDDSLDSNVSLPWDQRNLVFKAVELFRKTYGITDHFHVRLEKNIPEQAGLGGGSSDAAAALRILYRMYGVAADRREKTELAKKLGADVPFFMFARPARVQGIGEKLRFIDMPEKYKAVLIKPHAGISTQEAFRLLDSLDYQRADMDAIEASFKAGIIPQLANSLEYSAVKLLPAIDVIRQQCQKAGFEHVLMSGSGSTVFFLVPSDCDVSGFMKEMEQQGHWVKETGNFWRSMPALETERLRLRHLRHDDAQAIFDTYANDPMVTRYLTWDVHNDVTVTQQLVDLWLKEYEKEDRYQYIIELKETGELVGMIDVVEYRDGLPVIGYVSGQSFWNHGYMSEALEAMVERLLNDGYPNVIIEAVRENYGSNRVIEKNGFRFNYQTVKTMKNQQQTINSYILFK